MAERKRPDRSFARWTNVVLGAWLFVSAFLWRHTEASFRNTWIVGVIIAAVALGAVAVAPLRYVNTPVAMYLLLTSIFVPHAFPASAWHNGLVAVVVLVVSLAPNRIYGGKSVEAIRQATLHV